MDIPKDGREIRGCMFRNTALCELHMNNQIEKILSDKGIQTANHSLGYWVYPKTSKAYKEFNFKNEAKEVAKICSVFQTKCERRAGTHLIQGLNMLLFALLKKYQKLIDM